MGEKKFSRKGSKVPKIGFTQFLKIWVIFGNFSNFFFENFEKVFWPSNRSETGSKKKKISRKMSFFSAQNWVYPISERFGSFLALKNDPFSRNFLKFLIFLPSFFLKKKKNQKALIWSFSAIFQIFHFFEKNFGK